MRAVYGAITMPVPHACAFASFNDKPPGASVRYIEPARHDPCQLATVDTIRLRTVDASSVRCEEDTGPARLRLRLVVKRKPLGASVRYIEPARYDPCRLATVDASSAGSHCGIITLRTIDSVDA